jgi:hypothetical protein
MNSQEAAVLCRYVRALCPQQKFDEFTPDAWHDVLGDYQLTDARQAAARIARRQPFVAPSEIADEIGKIRGSRIHDFVYEPPAGERDPHYIARLRHQLAATGDGERPPVIHQALPARPVAELVSGLADALPTVPKTDDEVAKIRRPGPLGRECPDCLAAIGRPCRTNSGRERAPHEARTAAARGRHHDPDAEEQRRKEASRRLVNQTTEETP